MEKRLIFPTVMFVLAGASFLFGGWQYLQAQSAQAASQKRMAFIVTSIEKSSLATARKQELYAVIMKGLPAAPGVLGLDFSGSFASNSAGDSCTSDGQRTICSALMSEHADAAVIINVCGTCHPN
jgi:hypothetical protein